MHPHINHIIIFLLFAAIAAGCTRSGSDVGDSTNTLVSENPDSLLACGNRYLRSPETVDSAMMCFVIVADRTEGADDSLNVDRNIRANINLGFIEHSYRNDYHKAYDYLSQGLELAQTRGFDHYLPYAYLNIGVAMGKLEAISAVGSTSHGDYLSLIRRSFDEAIKHGQHRPAAFAYISLVNQCLENDDIGRLRDVNDKLRANPLPGDTPLLKYVGEISEAVAMYTEGDYTGCVDTLRNLISTEFGAEVNTEEMRYTSIYFAAIARDKAGDKQGYKDMMRDLEQRIETDGSPESRTWLYRILSEDSTSIGDKDKYLLKYYRAREAEAARGSLTRLNNISFLGELRKVKVQVEKENRNKRDLAITLWGVIVLFVIILAFMAFYVNTQRNKRRFIQKLYEKNMALLDKKIKSDKEPESDRNDDPEQHSDLADRIEKIFSTPEYICNTNFSLSELASLTASNTSYVSKALNTRFGKHFNTLLCEARIFEACRRLSSPEYDSLTIEAIAESVGIRSRSNFSSLFKRATGLSPSEFRKMSQNKRENS